jgi:RNA polymerase-associated protein LEO1
MQLLLGSEVLDLSVQDAHQDQSHLFLRHPKVFSYSKGGGVICKAYLTADNGRLDALPKLCSALIPCIYDDGIQGAHVVLQSILQSQGQLLRKMKFMPSSLTSKSHRLLTALVDSRHKKVYKVKKVAISTVDPEKEKEAKERAAEQRIRSKEDLQRKQEKVLRRFAPRISDYEHEQEANQQLSPGYLEGALDEEDEVDYSERRDSRRFQEQLEAEERAERKILSAKKVFLVVAFHVHQLMALFLL